MSQPEAQSGQEQDINPWSVAGAQNENGEVVAIDYLTLSQSVPQVSKNGFARLVKGY